MSLGALIIVVVAFVAIWLIFVRPQKRRQLAQQELNDSIAHGTEIITAGGLYATVIDVDEDELLIELAPGIRVRLARRAVAAVIPPDEHEELDEEEAEAPAEREEIAAGRQSSAETPS